MDRFSNLNDLTRNFILIMTLLVLSIPPSVASSRNRLEKIGYSTLPGNQVQINLDFSQKVAAAPLNFSTDNPARVVLDFPNTSLGLDSKSQTIGIGAVQSASAVETQDRTRVVLNLVRLVPFDIRIQDKRIYISVENLSTTSAVSSEPIATTPPPMTSQSTQKTGEIPQRVAETTQKFQVTPPAETPVAETTIAGPSIQNIDFRRTDEGAGRVEIKLSSPSIIVNMNEKGNDISIDFLNTRLPERLDRRLDVVDFGTPISLIDTYQEGNDVRMKVTAGGIYQHFAYQAENLYVIEVKKVVEEKTGTQTEAKKVEFKGQKVSFNFQNIDIRAALLLLTDLPGVNLNMVVPDHVAGSVTLRLKNIPWDQALNIILEANQLGMEQNGNVVMIDKKANIDKRKQEELAAQQAIRQLEPLRTEFIQVNYAKASDLEKLIRTKGEHSFLSARGNVSVDERTNKLIIQDTVQQIAEIRELIASLDGPTRQVLIESRVVVATDTFSKNLGVKFGYSGNQDMGSGNGVVIGGKMAGSTEYVGGTGFSADNTTPYGTGQGENFIVSLPAPGPAAALGLAIGKIGSYLLQLELSAAETEGATKIISSPRVITGNQQAATILQGTEIPYRTSDAQGIGQTMFKPAVLELNVTPQITPDDRIIMELNVKSDKVGQIVNDGNLTIDKREIKTKVLVDNGETLVLGGVYEQESRDTVTRIPFFGDLPLVGVLFRSKSNQEDKRELLIFVTPKIVKEAT